MQLRNPYSANGLPIQVIEVSDYRCYRSLGVATHETNAVPTGYRWALITASTDAYVQLNATSFGVPADVTDGTGPIFIPAGASRLIRVGGAANIGFVSPAASQLYIEWYE